MRRVLLLNVTYEPLTTVGLRRAVCLVLGGKAEVVHDDVQGAVLHAASVALATPSVIRLRRYVRVPYRNRVPLTRAALMRRDNYRCAYCGRRAETIDHVIPRSRGGAHAWENCVASCTICNHRKADRLLEELGWTLPVPPAVPRGAHWRLVGAQHDGDPQWAAYLREPSAALRTGKPALPYRTVRRTARPRRTRLRFFSFWPNGPYSQPTARSSRYFSKELLHNTRGTIPVEADAMQREIFTQDHDEFRDMVRAFIAKEIAPYHEQWERDGVVSRDVWLAAGRAGLLGIHIDEKYGGGGDPDYRYYVVLNEELARAAASGPMFVLHNDMIGPYLDRLCTPEQRERWFPGYCSGELITAIAMTEPGAGSDLQGIRSTAIRDGGHYVLNGQKTFISNGQLGDIVIVVARTDPAAGHRGISLLVVERGMPGFSRGRNLDKLGMHAQDTSELFFTDVRVPAANLLGEEGGGFVALMQNLPRERVTIGVTALAIAEQALADTIAYCKERNAFGQPIGRFQHSKFLLAEMATEIAVAREFTDRAITEHCADRLTTEEASMVKWWNTELCNRVTDRCVQLHGGYGYMREYRVGRFWADSRVQSIFGGTTEIQKEIIARSLGL